MKKRLILLACSFMLLTTPLNSEAANKNLGTYKITYYCPKCNGGYQTASGKRAKAGRTIAAPKNFKFGTKLKINGKWYTVEDRGGAIKGKRIDIFVSSHSKERGVKKYKVYKK